MESLRAYEERLVSSLRSEAPFKTYNKDITHAAVITRVLLQHARHKVRLLSNKLDSALYGTESVKDHIVGFLRKDGTSLHILVEADLSKDHPVRRLVADGSCTRERLKIKRVPPALTEKYSFNYLVADEFGYRFENDRREYAAFASFYERAGNDDGDGQTNVDRLIDFFDKLEAKSTTFDDASR